jgi:murein DD-endopeptidase MepM/ murein hydrolase activator NlpD
MRRWRAVLSWVAVTLAAACASPAAPPDALRRHDVVLPRDTETVEGRVPRDATLDSLLRQQKIEGNLVPALTAAIRGVFNPRDLRADQTYRVIRTLDGLLREFQYQIDADRFLRVIFKDRSPDGQPEFDVALVPYAKEVAVDAVTAEITRERPSLIGAFDALGENVELPLALAKIFGGEVDFNSELQRGDAASVLFERVMREGQFAGYGDIHAAVLENAGRRLVGIRFVGPDGAPGWFDERGRSLKRQFLKSPLPFEPRITSTFSGRRLHPLYGGYRAHLGVDYAAAVGTPVVAVAGGTVEVAGWSGDAGRMVAVRHSGGYETFYLHLSSFAAGVHPGAHVAQGQLIGRVGTSGASTGPHLDYRVKKNGAHVNPLLELSRMPPVESIGPGELDTFNRERDRALAELKTLAATRTTGAKSLIARK